MQRTDGAEPKWDLTRFKRPDLCLELFLSDSSIERLMGIERFPILEVLWINDNRFRSIRFIEHTPRLKSLYAHNNVIASLENAFKNCRFIETLTLQNNRIKDLRLVSEQLQHLSYLKELNLVGNPVAEESNYRTTLIYCIPTLKVLDRHGRRIPERLAHEPSGLSAVEKDLESYVARLKRRAEEMQEEEKRRLRAEAETEAREQMRLRTPPLPKALDFLSTTRPKTDPQSPQGKHGDGNNTNRTIYYLRRLEPYSIDQPQELNTSTSNPLSPHTLPQSPIRPNPKLFQSYHDLVDLRSEKALECRTYTM